MNERFWFYYEVCRLKVEIWWWNLRGRPGGTAFAATGTCFDCRTDPCSCPPGKLL